VGKRMDEDRDETINGKPIEEMTPQEMGIMLFHLASQHLGDEDRLRKVLKYALKVFSEAGHGKESK
jgi:hypothetical protein